VDESIHFYHYDLLSPCAFTKSPWKISTMIIFRWMTAWVVCDSQLLISSLNLVQPLIHPGASTIYTSTCCVSANISIFGNPFFLRNLIGSSIPHYLSDRPSTAKLENILVLIIIILLDFLFINIWNGTLNIHFLFWFVGGQKSFLELWEMLMMFQCPYELGNFNIGNYKVSALNLG